MFETSGDLLIGRRIIKRKSYPSLLHRPEAMLTGRSYINYANGDEELQNIYGPNVERLRNLKKTYDPAGLFNEFFPLS